ncbi:MaoC family dehydratase, partial [Streptomyces sp. MS06]|uniref:MaoC family dehydratase n=1 Tax=Streptomyces sp. MS06 TaxID=3385974 RepID=UPI00399F23EA
MAGRTEPAGGATTVVLAAPPALGPLLARGALLSPFKRPGPLAAAPPTRVALTGLRVEPTRLAAYERVCGFATGGDALPVTYPHVLGFPLAVRLMSDRAFPLPLLGLVHTSITLTRHTSLAVGGEYELTVHVDGLRPHRRGTEAVVVTELRDGGATVWESTSTYLARHRTSASTPAPPAAPTSPAAPASPAPPTSPAPPAPPAPPASSRPPQPPPHRPTPPQPPPHRPAPPQPPDRPTPPEPLPDLAAWRLADDLGRRYGAVSGDRNPIHLHPLTARLFGFPRTVAHGMWTVARCLAAHGVPDAVHAHAEFRSPVLLPGTVRYAARDGRFALRGADRLHLTGRI